MRDDAGWREMQVAQTIEKQAFKWTWHGRGHRFDPGRAHFLFSFDW